MDGRIHAVSSRNTFISFSALICSSTFLVKPGIKLAPFFNWWHNSHLDYLVAEVAEVAVALFEILLFLGGA